MTSSRDSAAELDRWGRGPREGWSEALSEFLYRRWFRVEWEGLEHVPARGGALLVANHAGMVPVDGGLIQYGIEAETGRRVYALAHDGFWRYPFAGTLLSRSGGVVAHPDNTQRLLADDGHLVVVFPEGAKGPTKPPSERYRLQRFGRGGFVEAAFRAGVPIVPIALLGTEDTTPQAATLRLLGQDVPISWNTLLLGPLLGPLAHLPVKIRGRILPPLHDDVAPGQDRYPRSRVMDRSEEVRTRIQAALDEMRAARTSLWRG